MFEKSGWNSLTPRCFLLDPRQAINRLHSAYLNSQLFVCLCRIFIWLKRGGRLPDFQSFYTIILYWTGILYRTNYHCRYGWMHQCRFEDNF